ncbi:uncharacterized protein LACBIDRAFT_242796 [Laccaria bicolor S238N-H82]|uniref:Predicted protein n=1 Tax=Laccaria bicolor (strain S238N-H82 / ATCC MYA-4686) TaxID=486041 RepID=B0CNN8_LACBS|nr:uncharacterized protein LACBIDRAFT_242796 [Laccaria bicolor S238N-H82]EDR15967.1 predicted protein [Laccaria bicolor S238N-H82]|eukprot:XP_001874175.1 predicted protein [Laccaria bicolor S238N-H82]
MTIKLAPLVLPANVDREKFSDFGREVKDIHPGNCTADEFNEIEEALYKHDFLLFRDIDLSLEQQFALVKVSVRPQSRKYVHKTDEMGKGIVDAYANKIPRIPQIRLIGHGTVYDHEGIPEITLRHEHHESFQKTRVPIEDEHPKDGSPPATRFFRWHMDSALYESSPSKATALYAIQVPQGPAQTVRYDDGSGDELSVTLGTTAFASGKIMFDILPKELKSFAVRAWARYAPHPFEWMARARATSTGLGLENEGLEKPLDTLSSWDEDKVKVYPFVWKNPVTGSLHLQVHPCAISEIHNCRSDPGTLYSDGGHITDLRKVREIVYKMQRPGIAPNLVYPHPWENKDLVIFNNRGLIHTIVGFFRPDQVRVFHGCSLAGSDEPTGPSKEDILKWVV